MDRPALRVLQAASNENEQSPPGDGDSRFSPEFFALANRVLDGRAAWRHRGLAGRGVRVMQAMGYLSPQDLTLSYPHAIDEIPALLVRAAAVNGCGRKTLANLRFWLSQA